MTVELIPALETDRAFFKAAHHLAFRPVIEPIFGWDEARQDRFADHDFDTRNPHIIHYEGRPVGAVGWVEESDHVWFGPIFILPDYQNRGLGRTLAQQFVEQSRQTGVALWLKVLCNGNERAKALYESSGFKIVGATNIHWLMEYAPGA